MRNNLIEIMIGWACLLNLSCAREKSGKNLSPPPNKSIETQTNISPFPRYENEDFCIKLINRDFLISDPLEDTKVNVIDNDSPPRMIICQKTKIL